MLKNLLIFLLFLMQTSTLIASKNIVITTGEWEPYTSQKYKNYGVANIIIKESFKLQNIDVQYKFYPWKRAMRYVKTGKYASSSAWTMTKRRKKDFIFSKEPIFFDKNVFIHLKDLPFKWDGDIMTLKQYRLGTSLGYQYSTKLEYAFHNNILKPDALIVGGIGGRPAQGFAEAGLDVYFDQTSPTVQDSLNAFLENRLEKSSGQGTCNHN